MKSVLYIFVLVASISAYCQAADDNYTPLVREGNEWCYVTTNIDQPHYTLRINGDTILNGIVYKKLYRSGVFYNEQTEDWRLGTVLHSLVRENDKKVYAICQNINCSNRPTAIISLPGIYNDEVLFYDFNDMEGFLQNIWHDDVDEWYDGTFVKGEVEDTCLLVDRKCNLIQTRFKSRLVEGIGQYSEEAGDLMCRYFWVAPTTVPKYPLAYMKNESGEYEYYSKHLCKLVNDYPYDLCRDFQVDIADVNRLVDVILNRIKTENNFSTYRTPDINGDGAVDITDVNILINYILGEIKSPLEK